MRLTVKDVYAQLEVFRGQLADLITSNKVMSQRMKEVEKHLSNHVSNHTQDKVRFVDKIFYIVCICISALVTLFINRFWG